MNTSSIVCPHCNSTIEITELLKKDIEQQVRAELNQQAVEWRKKTEEELARKLEEKISRENSLLKQQLATEEVERKQLYDKLQLTEEVAEKKAAESVRLQMQERDEQILEQKRRIEQSEKAQLELMKKQQLLEQERERMDIELQKKLNDERASIREQYENHFIEKFKLSSVEKDKKIEDMQKLIEDLQRKSQQGSQQTQGEIMELVLEDMLRSEFIYDVIKPVAKGIRGADIEQHVSENGRECGVILWESKRTKNWSKEFIPKLKEDQRNIRANIAAIATTVLPDSVQSFGLVDGVWVCDFRYAVVR